MLDIDSKVFIRTVTFSYTGKVVSKDQEWITLENVAWIADSGRWGEFLKTGEADEVEAYPDEIQVSIARGAVVEVCQWPHDLPRVTK